MTRVRGGVIYDNAHASSSSKRPAKKRASSSKKHRNNLAFVRVALSGIFPLNSGTGANFAPEEKILTRKSKFRRVFGTRNRALLEFRDNNAPTYSGFSPPRRRTARRCHLDAVCPCLPRDLEKVS